MDGGYQRIQLLTDRHTHRNRPCRVGDHLTVRAETAQLMIAAGEAAPARKRRSRTKDRSAAPNQQPR